MVVHQLLIFLKCLIIAILQQQVVNIKIFSHHVVQHRVVQVLLLLLIQQQQQQQRLTIQQL